VDSGIGAGLYSNSHGLTPLQGDEPLVDPVLIDRVATALAGVDSPSDVPQAAARLRVAGLY